MPTREEIIDAIHQADACLLRLRPAILVNPRAPLLEGEWTVRDCLSHVAARAIVTSSLRNLEARLKAAQQGGEVPRIDIDEVNASQVEERKDTTVHDLIEEALANHAKAIEGIQSLLEEQLTKVYPTIRGTEVTGAEFIFMLITRHEAGHLNDMEAALQVAR